MQSDKLNKIKERVQGQQNEITLIDEQFILAKELACLGEIIGREYELIKKQGEVIGFRQKPMKIQTYLKLVNSLKKYREMEARAQKRSMKKRKK